MVDIPEVIRTLTMGDDGGLWVGCDAPTLFRIGFPPGAGPATPTVERFGAKDGLPEDPWRFTTRVGGQTVVYGPSGIFRFDVATRRFQRDPRTTALELGTKTPLFRLAEGSDGTLWLGCQSEGISLRRAVLGADGLYRWDGAPLECSDAPVYSLRPEPDGTLWFGGVNGVFRYQDQPPETSHLSSPVLIRSVLKKGGGLIAQGADGLAPRIPYADNTLRFEYALPQLGPTSNPRYQIQLVGLDTTWSAWTTEPYRDYTNLRAGRYQFRVRACQNEGDTPTEASFAFQILRPWFRTWWAYGLYLFGTSLAMVALHRARIRMLKRRNEELETRVADATQALTQQATELEWMNHELRDLNEQKNHFLGIVSHDLKSPINGIVMAAETLRATQDAQLIALTAQSIETEGLAMGALIDRFLNVTALESGRIAVQPTQVDIRNSLKDALERHSARATAKGLPLRLLPGEDRLWAQADPFLLGEVLDNLISNALKFSRPGEPVQLRAERQGDWICMTVEDHGPGLQPEDHRKLFNRFARLSAKPTGGENSVGLGLSIARQLVEAMGGRLWADESRVQGAAFCIQLPSDHSES
jgi:signal transduction histidine kinase